jgi:cytochrome c-type biogenesis protein
VNVSATGLAVAFAAGVVAFASPCVLPLIPGYLSFLGGTQTGATTVDRRAAVLATIAFTAGFAAVFTVAGAGVGLVGAQFVNHRRGLELVGGALVIAMGVLMIAGGPLLLQREWRVPLGSRPRTAAGAAVVGAAFAVGWSPCIGPTLASILAIAAAQGRAADGALLLAAYSLGLALPLIAAGLFFTTFLQVATPIRPYLGTISRVAGVLLILTGVLLASGRLEQISARLGQ